MLYDVMERMCDVISGISVDDMLGLTSISTEQLQALLRERYSIKC